LHGLGRPARPTGHHRHTRRRCFQIDDAEALDIQACAAGAARHREHVGHRVVGGQFGAGHPTGEGHVLGDACLPRKPVQRRQVRAAAHDDQGGAVDALADGRQCPDQHVLALAGHQPG
jgi:hypothetical protein